MRPLKGCGFLGADFFGWASSDFTFGFVGAVSFVCGSTEQPVTSVVRAKAVINVFAVLFLIFILRSLVLMGREIFYRPSLQ